MAEALLLKSGGGGGVDCDAATVRPEDVLSGKTFGGKDNDELQTGTMVNNGAKTASLNCGGSYTIPAGYHNGSGKVTANSLASQTSANAAAGDIIKGKTAWVNGAKRTGTLEDRASQTNAVSVSSSTSVGLVRIPFGAYRTKTGSGYPEIVLNKSQIDYIAKKRYGGVAFNGATFDGIMLSGVAKKTNLTDWGRSWKYSGYYRENRYKFYLDGTPLYFTPTVDVSPLKKIRITAYAVSRDLNKNDIGVFNDFYMRVVLFNKTTFEYVDSESVFSQGDQRGTQYFTAELDVSGKNGQYALGVDELSVTFRRWNSNSVDWETGISRIEFVQ